MIVAFFKYFALVELSWFCCCHPHNQKRKVAPRCPIINSPPGVPRVPGTLPGPSELILCLSKGIATWAQFHWWSDTCLQLFLEKFVWDFVYTVSCICYSFANSEDDLGSSTQPNVSLAWVFSLAATVTLSSERICLWICWRWYLAEAPGRGRWGCYYTRGHSVQSQTHQNRGSGKAAVAVVWGLRAVFCAPRRADLKLGHQQ